MKNKGDLPTVSIVLPVRNEEKFIERTIRQLQEQVYPADLIEIIVVDGQSEDNTREIVERLMRNDSRISLYENPRKLSSAARNIGTQKARGDIILFVDGHVYIPSRNMIFDIVEGMRKYSVKAVSRPQYLNPPGITPFQEAVAAARASWLGHGLDSTIYDQKERIVNPTSSGAGYHKDIFRDVGYFDENFDAAEDVEFNYRVHKAGYKAISSPKFAVLYYPRKNLQELFRQMKRYGLGRWKFLVKHKSDFTSGAMLLFLASSGTVLLTLLSIFDMVHISLVIAIIFSYISVVSIESVRLSYKSGFLRWPIFFLIFLCIHSGLSIGFAKGLFLDLLNNIKSNILLPKSIGAEK